MKTIIRLAVVAVIATVSYFLILPIFLKKAHDASVDAVPSDSAYPEMDHTGSNANLRVGRKSDPSSSDGKDIVISDSTTLEEIRKIFSDYKLRNTNTYDQAEFAGDLVKDLCEHGLADLAWEFIEPTSGVMRNTQLVEFFKNAKLSRNEIIGKLEAFEFTQDLQRALNGYLLRIKPSDYVEEISSPEIKKLQESLGKSPSDALRLAIDRGMNDMFSRRDSLQDPPSDAAIEDLKESIRDMASKGLVDKGDLFAVVMGGGATSFQKWDILKEYAVDDGGLPENMKKALIRSMVVNNPTRAANGLLETADSRNPSIVDTMVDEWVATDSAGATNWYSENQSTLAAPQKNLVADAFAKSALTSNEYESARQWAGQISDPKLKQERLNDIAEKEANFLQNKNSQ